MSDVRARLLAYMTASSERVSTARAAANLDAYRAEVLAEAAALIRSWHDRLPGEHECCDGNAAQLLFDAASRPSGDR